MAGHAYPEHRRRMLIDRDFQLRFVMRMASLLFCYLTLFLGLAVIIPSVLAALKVSTQMAQWVQYGKDFRWAILLTLVALPLAGTVTCLFLHGVRETFRIAGPKYRFDVTLEELKKLNIPRGVKVRENDYLRDTAQRFDEAVIALHDTFTTLKAEMVNVAKALTELPANESPQARQKLESSLRVIQQQLDRVQVDPNGNAPSITSQAVVAPIEPMDEPEDSPSTSDDQVLV